MKIDRKKRQQNKCPDNYGTVLTYFSIILLFFRNININIDINIPFFSISISKSRFWTWRFQDQDQYQYFGKPEFNIKIKINMTNILKNIGKSIYCPIPAWRWTSTFECSKSPSSWEVNSLSAGISRISLCHAFSSKLNAKWVSDRTCLFCWALWPPGALPPLLLLCLRFFPPPSLPSFFCTSWSLLSSSSFLSLFWKAN